MSPCISCGKPVQLAQRFHFGRSIKGMVGRYELFGIYFSKSDLGLHFYFSRVMMDSPRGRVLPRMFFCLLFEILGAFTQRSDRI